MWWHHFHANNENMADCTVIPNPKKQNKAHFKSKSFYGNEVLSFFEEINHATRQASWKS
jgi:hypothetical protein